MSKKELTYERAYAELHKILQAIQNDEIGLDELAKELKRAKELIEFCQGKLKSVESELDEIFEGEED